MLLYHTYMLLYRIENATMSAPSPHKPEECNCFVVRSAARHVTQLYDQLLAPVELHVTQFSILAKLKRLVVAFRSPLFEFRDAPFQKLRARFRRSRGWPIRP